MIPHLEFGIGAFFPKNGMIQISESIAKLAESLGVVVHLNAKVSSIKTDNARVAGIETETGFSKADVVVSAIDVSQTYSKLLGMQGLGEKYLKLPKSTSAIIWYWGIKRKTEQTGLHNIFFSKDYKSEFESLFRKKEMTQDPTIYLNISSKERSEDAPEFGENWFVMVNAPANEGQDWDKWIPETRQIVVKRLSQELGFDVESEIEVETILEPRTLESRTGAIGGALYGSNSNSQFAAFLRHANFSTEVKNLFFCGGTVHPGGGIPLALQSASIAADYVKNSSF
jgi:phytoene desaturase